MKTIILLGLMHILANHSDAQQVMDLYLSKTIPGAKPAEVPEKSETGTDGVVRVARSFIQHSPILHQQKKRQAIRRSSFAPVAAMAFWPSATEGYDVAKTFASWGIHAFVLKYRLPNNEWQSNPSFAPLQDAQEAIRLVRSKAADWHIDETKLASWDFQQADTWLQPQVLISTHLFCQATPFANPMHPSSFTPLSVSQIRLLIKVPEEI